jgi:hypothetical protein
LKIDSKDFTKYVDFHFPSMPDKVEYRGIGIEGEGKSVEKLLSELPMNTPIRVKDTKFRKGQLASRVYKIINIEKRWEDGLFKFSIFLEGIR